MKMATTLPITPVKKLKPFKSTWRIQVKILHAWKHYVFKSGESLELILADIEGTKIHASVKKDHIQRYEKRLTPGEWRFIQDFNVSHAIRQYRTTSHVYKIAFVKETYVNKSENLTNEVFLDLVCFNQIHEGKHNQSILCVVNVGQLDELEVNNKPAKKIEFELLDENNDRINCTLWNSFASQIYQACATAGAGKVICLIRFAKIREFRDVKSVSNAFESSLLVINPTGPDFEKFVTSLPDDGLSLTLAESTPKLDIIVKSVDGWDEFPIISIDELKNYSEVGKARILCTIFAVDTDWGWYYFGCLKRNHKKVRKIKAGLSEVILKPKWMCDQCKKKITTVVAKFKIHLKVKDETSETTLLLFDTLAAEIVKFSAADLLDGSFDEIEDPEDLPDAINELIGQTFEFVLSIDNENLRGGHDIVKVAKVMSTKVMVEDYTIDDSDNPENPSQLVSGDQGLMMLSNSGFNSDDQASATKKQCFLNIKQEVTKVHEES